MITRKELHQNGTTVVSYYGSPDKKHKELNNFIENMPEFIWPQKKDDKKFEEWYVKYLRNKRITERP